MKLRFGGATYDETFVVLKDCVVATSISNPSLNFYMENLILYLLSLFGLEYRHQIPLLMDMLLIDGGKGVDLSGTEVVNQKIAANIGLEIFIDRRL